MPAKKQVKNGELPQKDPSGRTTYARRSRPSKPGGAGRNLTIIVDTREQRPFEFPDTVKTCVQTLNTGDYSVVGWCPFVSVERKGWADFYGCLAGTNRDRFERELERLSRIRFAAVVVEAAHDQLWKPFVHGVPGGGSRRSQIPPLVAQKSVIAWMWRYKVPFWFCGNRRQAMKWTLLLLDDAVRQLLREEKLAGEAEKKL